MAIETAFENLQRQLDRLQDEFGELRVNAQEFYPAAHSGAAAKAHPVEPPPPPVVSLADRATDLEGDIQEAREAAGQAVQAVRHPRQLALAQASLVSVQRGLNRALRRFATEVAAHEQLQPLLQMGRKLGLAWPEWTRLIQSIISEARERMLDCFQALADCWQELADKLAAGSVTVQATNIGQQITTREPLGSSVSEAA